jgi:hypothetical protein
MTLTLTSAQMTRLSGRDSPSVPNHATCFPTAVLERRGACSAVQLRSWARRSWAAADSWSRLNGRERD